MYGYANESSYPFVKSSKKTIRSNNRVHYNLNSKKSNKFSPFTGSNSEWYQRHETLWEKFIKDHLLIGKQGFVDGRTIIKSPENRSQHFHVDPRKCKEIHIDIKADGDKSVSISFVTSESNVHNLLPAEITGSNRSRQLSKTNAVEDKENSSNDCMSNRNNKFVKEIFNSGKESNDICIDTKSLEHFNQVDNIKEKNVEGKEICDVLKTNVLKNSGKEIKPSKSNVQFPIENSVKINSISVQESQCHCTSKNFHLSKPRFPTNQAKRNRKDLCHRTISSKLLCKKHSDIVKLESKLKNKNFCVERVEVINKPQLINQRPIKVPEIETNSKKSNNNIFTPAKSGDKERDKLHESSKIIFENKENHKQSESCFSPPSSENKQPNKTELCSKIFQKKLLEIKKKKSDKSNLSTEKNCVKLNNNKLIRNKKNTERICEEKQSSSAGSWFGFTKKFNIFKIQKSPLKENKQKKIIKNTKLTENIIIHSSSTEKSTTVESKNGQIRTHKTSNMSDSSESVHGDTGDSEQHVNLRHYSHRVRHHSRSMSRSKHKSKGPLTRDRLNSCVENSMGDRSKSKHHNDFQNSDDDLLHWLKDQYIQLAGELAEARRNPRGKMSPEMFESRRYVLERLTEILEEKKHIEDKESKKIRR